MCSDSIIRISMAEQMVIGLSGEPGAGKDTVKEYLQSRYGASTLGFSLILKDILNRLNLPLVRESYAVLAEALRGAFGEGILSQVLENDVRRSSSAVVVIDGIRKRGELEVLKKLPGFRFFFVETDLRIRFDRIKNRGSKADDLSKTFEDFVRDHESAADRDVKQLKDLSDAVVENNGTRDELFASVDEIMKNFLG